MKNIVVNKRQRRALASALRQMNRSTRRALAALDHALEVIDASNKPIDALEEQARRDKKRRR